MEKNQFEYDIVLNKPALKNKSTYDIYERKRGIRAESYKCSFLKKGQLSLKHAGFFPLCESNISNKDISKVIRSNKV